MKINELINKKIAILWFWLEGKSSLKFLQKIGSSDITILDKDFKDDLVWYKYISWDNYLDNLWDFDLIFKSPWISLYNDKIIKYKDKLISNADIFFDNYTWKVIWITATKWKSTSATLLYLSLKWAWYNVKLVGNIWNPILEEVDILNNDLYDFIIYELSSFMLENLKPKLFIWILWNIYPCHLDWHNNSMDVYIQAKLNILSNSSNVLINENFVNLFSWESKNFWKLAYYSFDNEYFYINRKSIFENKDIIIAWEHNSYNISSVLWALDIIWDEKLFKSLKKILSEFKWLSHRQEQIGIYNNIIFIDDSISTTPASTIEAIKTFWDKISSIILWGSDIYAFPDESFQELAFYLEKYNIKNIILFIDTWSKVFWDLSKNMSIWEEKILNISSSYNPFVFKTDSMEEAVKFSYKNTKSNKICILSSGSPSFGLFKSYIDRASEFVKFVLKYKD